MRGEGQTPGLYKHVPRSYGSFEERLSRKCPLNVGMVGQLGAAGIWAWPF